MQVLNRQGDVVRQLPQGMVLQLKAGKSVNQLDFSNGEAALPTLRFRREIPKAIYITCGPASLEIRLQPSALTVNHLVPLDEAPTAAAGKAFSLRFGGRSEVRAGASFPVLPAGCSAAVLLY